MNQHYIHVNLNLRTHSSFRERQSDVLLFRFDHCGPSDESKSRAHSAYGPYKKLNQMLNQMLNFSFFFLYEWIL